MLVITGVFENERFIPDMPVTIPQKKKVIVTIEEEKPVETSLETTAEKVDSFRKKYNRGIFVEHLKKQVAEGQSFDFDVQKVVDGTETEEDMQARYRLEKQF
ncbi:MAG: DUF104 domain-containing protein [Spirochaetes bacterium]|nr:DUF104 domain-containing protein [Spirochaetota bacterium]